MTITTQYTFAFNNWLFGGPDGGGVQVLAVSGLEDLPAIRAQDLSRGYQDGSMTGRDFFEARTITMQLQIMSDSKGSMFDYLDQLKNNLKPQQSGVGVLNLYLPNRNVQRVYARVRRRQLQIDPDYTYGRATAVVEFFCPDPRVYNDISQLVSGTTATGVKTREYDRTYDLTYPTASVGKLSTFTLNTAGNYETFPVFTITGACSQPSITNLGTGAQLSFPTVTMAAGDTLTIDSDFKTVLFNGAPSRNLLSTASRWWSLAGSSTTDIGFSSASGVPTLTVTWRDAFI
jgi:hypothetical protein